VQWLGLSDIVKTNPRKGRTMPEKTAEVKENVDELKSARKKFMVNRVKTSIMQLNDAPDAEVEAKLAELLIPLKETFGAEEGLKILEGAIVAADDVIVGAIAEVVKQQVAERRDNE
jgi:hypothetical protein